MYSNDSNREILTAKLKTSHHTLVMVEENLIPQINNIEHDYNDVSNYVNPKCDTSIYNKIK